MTLLEAATAFLDQCDEIHRHPERRQFPNPVLVEDLRAAIEEARRTRPTADDIEAMSPEERAAFLEETGFDARIRASKQELGEARVTQPTTDRQACPDCGHPHLPMPMPWTSPDGTKIDPKCGWPEGPESCTCRRRRTRALASQRSDGLGRSERAEERSGPAPAARADRPPEPPSHVHFDELYCGQCGDWNTLDEIEGHLLSEGRETPAHARLVSIEAASPPSATEAERMRRALVEADLVWDWGREGAIARARITDFARTVAEKYAALGASPPPPDLSEALDALDRAMVATEGMPLGLFGLVERVRRAALRAATPDSPPHVHDWRDFGSRGEGGRPDIRCEAPGHADWLESHR